MHAWIRHGAALSLALAALSPAALKAYAGEAGSGDGPVAAYQGLAVSTHHTHLTRALAYCAGFPGDLALRNPINPLVDPATALAAERLALNDELTDQGTITGTDANGNPVGPVWSNLNTVDWSYQLPSAASLGCSDSLTMVYPILQGAQAWNPVSGFFTNRFSPWAGQFHFPQDDGLADDLAALRAFAVGTTSALGARSQYGFGASGANTWSGSCYRERGENLATGAMKPGSIEAFATYLHTLGDSYSHRMCRLHWLERQTPPWYYHTPPAQLQATCGFNDHGFEFGCPDTRRRAGFLEGTVDGALAVYGELVGYALVQGIKPRIASVDAYEGWLRRQIERYAMSFRTIYDADAGTCRVSFTYALMKACDAAATAATPCLPDVEVANGGTCNAGGKTTECPGGTVHFPMTPACAGK